jgi:hypothetical protein
MMPHLLLLGCWEQVVERLAALVDDSYANFKVEAPAYIGRKIANGVICQLQRQSSTIEPTEYLS